MNSMLTELVALSRTICTAGAGLRALHAQRLSPALRAALKPGDVLLVEGNNHVSGVIKYLTQSTWSHAALYVGPIGDRETEDGEPLVLVEANLGEGVVGAPLSKYCRYHTRICRPTGLTADDRARVCAYAAERIGFDYDVKNIIDLMRYPDSAAGAPALASQDDELGSGHPTRIICSALIAQAFESALSDPAQDDPGGKQIRARGDARDPALVALCAARFRHFALFRGGQADVENGFDYSAMRWPTCPWWTRTTSRPHRPSRRLPP